MLPTKVPHLMNLADLSPAQIYRVLQHSHQLKKRSLPLLAPLITGAKNNRENLRLPTSSLFGKSIALLFSKRSTRTRLSAETSALLLGGNTLFLGKEDIQLGANESVRDSARVIGGMCQGIFARVGEHHEIEELAKHSPVPVLNALSDLWHPTQILADLLTLHENAHLFQPLAAKSASHSTPSLASLASLPPKGAPVLPVLPPLTIAYIGDSANILHEMLVTYPRLGHKLRVATPPQDEYRTPKEVWDRVVELGCNKQPQGKGAIWWGENPREAVRGADVVVTDTWISMGKEHQKAARLRDFASYSVTEKLCQEGGANPDWKFMHSLPRKRDEVDDEIFYGPRSLVFLESDNRKWTIMALFDMLFGSWDLGGAPESDAATDAYLGFDSSKVEA